MELVLAAAEMHSRAAAKLGPKYVIAASTMSLEQGLKKRPIMRRCDLHTEDKKEEEEEKRVVNLDIKRLTFDFSENRRGKKEAAPA